MQEEMKKRKSAIPSVFVCLFLLAVTFASCKNTASFTLLEDNSIAFELDCTFEQNGAIQKLLESVGTDFNQLNMDDLRQGLLEEGFKNVEAYHKEEGGIIVKGILPPDNLIVTAENDVITFKLTPENFRDFYHGSSEKIAAVFDIFLIPALADDEETASLDENGYLELIASFYGQNFTDEISKSSLNIQVRNKKKNSTQKVIFFPSLFTLKNNIEVSL